MSGYGECIIMAATLNEVKEILKEFLSFDCIQKFKIGITNDITLRERQYQEYEDYTALIHIASGDNDKAIALESKLIGYFMSLFPQKCENCQNSNPGNAKDADKVYVAIKIDPCDIKTLQIIQLMQQAPIEI